jgi:DNA invertase Pin-like site-specific DNA recombinase
MLHYRPSRRNGAWHGWLQDKRKFDIVLVWKFDRFARSLNILVDSLALLQELGIDFISYKENIDTTTHGTIDLLH